MKTPKIFSYYDLTKAARELGIGQYTLYYTVYKRKIVPEPTIKLGKRYYYSGSDFVKLKEIITDLIESGVVKVQGPRKGNVCG